ncbi:MAG: type II/IV secretion system ATPase subunit [Enterocloster bolteae]
MAQESKKRENRREPDSHIVETPSRPEDEEKPERKKGVGSQEPERVVCTPRKRQPPNPIPQPEKEEKKAIIETQLEEDEEDAAVFRQGGTALRTHNLFFSPQNEAREFTSVLQEVQEYISSQYSTLIMDDDSEETREQIKRYITKYVQDNRIAVKGMEGQELIDTMYTEMAGFSFLHKYVFGEGIEEIDINSYKDIEIQYAGGETKKLEERFESPQHAINVVRRMLHVSGMVLDNASPAVLGHLSKNIRIAAMKTPLVDEDVGVVASIRIVNPQSMKAEDFVRGGTATMEMLDFLTECVRYGISVCVAGATSSGKTTLMGWLLTTIPDHKRIYTIESGSRELDLVREKDGKVTNSVIHAITRDSENDRQRVDQITLLDMALRFNPDVIVVGEMRGPEANAAQEAARTGVAVITTIHSNSCEATYRRMVSLCKRAVDMTDETLMAYVTEAYPIVAFCKQLENRERRLMEIMECEILEDGSRRYRPLYQYEITKNYMEEGKFIIEGSHRKVNTISDSLAKRLTENGMPGAVLERLRGGIV